MNLDYDNTIQKTINFVKKVLHKAEGGHDWWHIYRVWKLSKQIAHAENKNINMIVIELGALLHDIADSKFNNGNENIGIKKADEFLNSINIDSHIINHVTNIIKNISFKGGRVKQSFSSTELNIIQDADRLDALGAIGIARTFNYGGYKNREIYNPNIKPNLNMTKQEYKDSTAPSINHFYEKLLLLKKRMLLIVHQTQLLQLFFHTLLVNHQAHHP